MPRTVNPRPQFLDSAGDPLVSGKLHVFESGTDTLKSTFADVNLSIQNENPVPLTADGRLPNVFFDGTARMKLTDSADVQIWDIDPVGGENIGGNFEEWNPLVIYSMNNIVIASDDNFYRSFTNGNEGNDPTTTPSEWEQIEFISVWNTNVTYDIGDTVKGSDNNFYRGVTASNQGNDPTLGGGDWETPFDLSSPGPIGDTTANTGDFTDLTAGTLDTGQGANDLFGMDQGVKTTDDVVFQNLTGKNRVINGDVSHWQRGTSFTPIANTLVYTADRFAVRRGTSANYTVSRQGAVDEFSVRVQRDISTTETNSIFFLYAAETADVADLAGGDVALSFDMTAGADFSDALIGIALAEGQGIDESTSSLRSSTWTSYDEIISENQAITTTKTRYTFTGSMSAAATQLGIKITFNAVGTAGANDWYEITNIQFERGQADTGFEKIPTAETLLLCQRYFAKTYDQSVDPGTVNSGEGAFMKRGTATNATNGFSPHWAYPVTMRITPTITSYSPDSGASGMMVTDANATLITGTDIASTPTLIGTGGCQLGNSASLQGTLATSIHGVQATADAEL